MSILVAVGMLVGDIRTESVPPALFHAA